MSVAKKFQEQFGLDYLRGGASETQEKPGPTGPSSSQPKPDFPPGLESAIIAYSGMVLRALKAAPPEGIHLFSLADQTSLRLDTLLPVINYLASKGWVERVSEDRVGNDAYRLTALGVQISPQS